MYKISGPNIKKLIPLLKKADIDFPITFGVLDGTFSGYALADDIECPKKAFIIHKHIGFLQYLGGVPDPSEAKAIADTALNYKSDRHYCNWVELAGCPDAVARIIKTKLPDMKSFHRISWNHNPGFLKNAPPPLLPDGCTAVFLNKEIFKHKFLRYETEMFWDDIDVFLKKAFGTVILDKKGGFLGVCGAVSASDGFYEINIEVKKEHRRKGIGYAVAYKFIEECYRRDSLPHWDCNEHNKASQAIAKKLGFIEAGRYPLVSWTYKP